MGIVLGILFMGAGVVAVMLYGGTPHGGPTSVCGPITFFGNHFTANGDCRYISIAELGGAGILFFLGIISALTARPNRRK